MLEDYFVDDFEKDYNKINEVEPEVSDFFYENLMMTRESVDDEEFRKFTLLESNGARVAFVLSLESAHELPVQIESNETKDSLKTKIFKESGNTAFSFGHYEVAIEEYNKAIIIAPKHELGVLLANRSAAFYHMECYLQALRDCDEALKVGYPNHLLYKLEERRARCLLALKCHAKAIESFKAAIMALDEAKVPKERKKKIEADMRVMLTLMIKGEELNEKQGLTKRMQVEIENERLKIKESSKPRIKDCNPLYPACSRSVEIRDDGGDVGRHAVSTRDVKPGEILAIEEPHCASLLGEKRSTHCHRCTVRLGAPYPANCYRCSSVAYCSPNCRDLDDKLHEIECEMLGPLWCSNISITCVLALRAVIQQPYFKFVQLYETIFSKWQPSRAEPYRSNDYGVFHRLVTHERERTSEDLFHRAYVSAWLLRLLKVTSYFPENVKTPDTIDQPLSKGELLVAGAILHHIQLLQFNSHEISEFVRSKKKPSLANGKSLFIGGGVYPTVALFNHSCNPGVVRYFVGSTMVVRAIRSIPAGEEISENYGPIFTEEKEKERQRKLRLQYWFDCGCEACKNHWPLLEDLDPNVLRFKCDSCDNVLHVNVNADAFMIACSKCGKSTNILKGLKAMQDTDALHRLAKRSLDENKHTDALKSYLDILRILDENLALPIRDYHICQQDVRKCMLAMGNSADV